VIGVNGGALLIKYVMTLISGFPIVKEILTDLSLTAATIYTIINIFIALEKRQKEKNKNKKQ